MQDNDVRTLVPEMIELLDALCIESAISSSGVMKYCIATPGCKGIG